jgi:RimJ/RimL family protein N-acetyltransferase
MRQRTILTLPDGTALVVRPLERTDRAVLEAAVARLSPTTRYLRFAAPKPRLTKADLDLLLDVDHHDHEALMAFDPATGEGVAVARYVRLAGEPDVAELAITVGDAWQRRGVGTALTGLLIERARAEGLHRLRAVTLGENRGAQAMVLRTGFRPRGIGGLLAEFELDLTDQTPSAAAARSSAA